ncbi:MAG: DUF975 family protein [Oscillospiraceae bacterium]|nr:DUF975 family protein [Oscillospiraceae bacterium]
MSIIGERRKYFKKEAKFFLRYNYLKQIFMTSVVILTTFGLNAVKASIINLFRLNYNLYAIPFGVFFDLLAFFIVIPMYLGIIYVNIKLFEGETVPVSGMFYYFSSSANLMDCYKFIVAMAGRIAAFAVPFLLFGTIFSKLRDIFALLLTGTVSAVSVNVDIVMVCACVIYLSAFIACLVFFMRYFAAVYIFVKNPCLSMSDIIQKSSKLMRKRKIEALKLSLSFIVWILISYYLAGFLYIFFTLPYIMLAYTSFLTYLLAESGGDEFLSAPMDYINEVIFSANRFDITDKSDDQEKDMHTAPSETFNIIDKINDTIDEFDKIDDTIEIAVMSENYDSSGNYDYSDDGDYEDLDEYDEYENYEIDDSEESAENNKKVLGFLRGLKRLKKHKN